MATIFQNFRLLRCPKFFSEIFLPFVPFGFCPAASASGPRLPRHDTAALGSPRRPRRRGGAAPGGQGRRGCAERRRPWPRRRVLGRENLLRHGIRLWRVVNEDVDGLSVWWILFSQLIGKFAKTFAPMFGVVFLWSPGFVFYWKLDLWVVFFYFRRGFLFGNRLGLTIQKLFFSLWRVRSNETSVFHNLKNGEGVEFCFQIIQGSCFASPSQSKKCSWASGVSILMWTHVTAAFVQVAWLEPKFSDFIG